MDNKDKMNIKIRKGELKDANAITRFNLMIAKETENKELDFETVLRGVKAVVKDPHKGFYLVGESKGEIVGQLMVTPEWSDWRNMNFLWIQSVYVREDLRKQGIFSALYHHLKDMARYKKNVAGLRLYVEVNNETGKKVYEALGMHKPGYDIYEALC
jgi:ribosomal protein S18 acetylase RimI-like enzyme